MELQKRGVSVVVLPVFEESSQSQAEGIAALRTEWIARLPADAPAPTGDDAKDAEALKSVEMLKRWLLFPRK